MPANPLNASLDLLETAHVLDTAGHYDPRDGDDGDAVSPHYLELAVALRMAIEPSARTRTTGAIFGFRSDDRQANRAAGRKLSHALAGRQDTGGRLPAKGTDARKTYDAAAREGQRWRQGKRQLGPRYRGRLLSAAVQAYVSAKPGSRGVAKLNRLTAPGDRSVTFKGDYQLRNPSPPPDWLPVRTHKQITAHFRSYETRSLQPFVVAAKAGDWRSACDLLESAFWPIYFTDAKGNRSGNIGQWIHADGPLEVTER